MQKDTTVFARVNRMDRRKANRLQEVTALPESAEHGDMVAMENQVYYHIGGRWRGFDDVLSAQLQELVARVAVLEGGDENA